jgi:type II secretion system protein N
MFGLERGRLGAAGVAIACALLTLFFVLLGFPYDRLGQRIAHSLEQSTGSQLSFASAGLTLTLAGPALEWHAVEITGAIGDARLSFERVRLRPAWSLAWLRLDPALYLDLDGPGGRVAGVATLGAEPGFAGRLENVNLMLLPAQQVWPDATLAGTLDANLDVRAASPAPEGEVQLAAREGNFAARGLPLALPFDELTGELGLGGGRFVEVRSIRMEGPLFQAQVRGEIGAAPSFLEAPLALDIEIQAQPRFHPTLRELGVRVDRAGAARLRLAGTPADPEVEVR